MEQDRERYFMEHIVGRVGATERARGRAQAEGSVVFDWVMVILGSLFLAGLHIDGWAHNHGKVDQSFFTPWHAIFYSGFLLLAGALGGVIARNRLYGYSWARSTPHGYEYALP